jgi:hypothetical protein
LTSKQNNRSFYVGPFEVLSVKEIQAKINGHSNDLGHLIFSHIIGDVRALHRAPENNGSVFQVASQFNCLEMVGPGVHPRRGITIYANDPTQGPACALSCPAATVFRNYFVNGKGQNEEQIDMLKQFGSIVNNDANQYWEMKNGYCLPATNGSIGRLSELLANDAALYQQCYDSLAAGIQWSTEVLDIQLLNEVPKALQKRNNNNDGKKNSNSHINDDSNATQLVCQVFTSALPVSYATAEATDWEVFAIMALKAAFDIVLSAAYLLAIQRNQRVKVYLTAVGGGAFGNKTSWIVEALNITLAKHQNNPLDVYLVHYSGINPDFLAVSSPQSSQNTVDSNSINIPINNYNSKYAKYEKMIEMRIPIMGVRRSMIIDGFDIAEIDAFIDEYE